MKIRHTLTLLVVVLAVQAFAQDGRILRQKRDQIKALKVAYFTNELALTPEESAKFWPLYNAFEDKQQELKKLRLKGYILHMEKGSFDHLTDKEATALLLQLEGYDDDLYQAKKKFMASLKGILTPIKILRLKRAEDNFNKKLLKEYRDMKKGN
jgi:Spy/CpxP family protein refolding chaperone